jgi:hypothetical protein
MNSFVPEPGIFILFPLRFPAAVLRPLDVRQLPQNIGLDERADIHSHAVVQVRVPGDGLFGQRLPPNENGVRPLTGQDQFELFLQRLGGTEPQVGNRRQEGDASMGPRSDDRG